MSRPASVPSYRLHKQSGQAVVTLPDRLGNRRDVLLGKYGTVQSRAEYVRVIAEWEAGGRARPPAAAVADLTINELILAYYTHCEEYYRSPDGEPTSEVGNVRRALRLLRALYGHTPAAGFDSLALDAVRARMIEDGLCRNRVNKDADRIKRMFKWAVAKRMLPVGVYQLLQTVEGLRAGRSTAKETEPVKPVPEAWVEATLPYCRPQVAAMVQLQLLTGMRPGEVTVMRTIDLDTSGKLWLYRPGSDRGPHGRHKNAWRGHGKVIVIGPRAQSVLKPWLRLNVEEYLFQPRESRAAYDRERKRRRKSKVPPSQANRKPKAKPRRAPRDHYTVSSYDQSVGNAVVAANKARACAACKDLAPEARCEACQAAAVPHWHPNRLRHTKATEIRREAGIDAARAVLGHRSPAITEVYAELDMDKAAAVMERIG
jgi:integrase